MGLNQNGCLPSFLVPIVRFFAGTEKERLPYVGRDVLSPGERAFYPVLKNVVQDKGVVLCQVSLSALVKVESMADRSKWQTAFNMINSKSIDFVVCDPKTMETLFAVELDDKSHRRQERQDRDAFVNELFETIGTPLVRIRAARSYSVQAIHSQIMDVVESQR